MIHQPQQIQQTKRKHQPQFIVEQSVILVVVQYNIICIDGVNFFFQIKYSKHMNTSHKLNWMNF